MSAVWKGGVGVPTRGSSIETPLVGLKKGSGGQSDGALAAALDNPNHSKALNRKRAAKW